MADAGPNDFRAELALLYEVFWRRRGLPSDAAMSQFERAALWSPAVLSDDQKGAGGVRRVLRPGKNERRYYLTGSSINALIDGLREEGVLEHAEAEEWRSRLLAAATIARVKHESWEMFQDNPHRQELEQVLTAGLGERLQAFAARHGANALVFRAPAAGQEAPAASARLDLPSLALSHAHGVWDLADVALMLSQRGPDSLPHWSLDANLLDRATDTPVAGQRLGLRLGTQELTTVTDADGAAHFTELDPDALMDAASLEFFIGDALLNPC